MMIGTTSKWEAVNAIVSLAENGKSFSFYEENGWFYIHSNNDLSDIIESWRLRRVECREVDVSRLPGRD